MEWSHTNSFGLASRACRKCGGAGIVAVKSRRRMFGVVEISHRRVCACVLRAVFRACLAEYYRCQQQVAFSWKAFRRFDYMADFCLIARRALRGADHRLFRLHFLEGHDWTACCPRLNIERGAFFHAVYGVEARLGRALCDVRPYALYPLDEYYGGCVRKAKILPFPEPAPEEPKRKPLRPKVRRKEEAFAAAS